MQVSNNSYHPCAWRKDGFFSVSCVWNLRTGLMPSEYHSPAHLPQPSRLQLGVSIRYLLCYANSCASEKWWQRSHSKGMVENLKWTKTPFVSCMVDKAVNIIRFFGKGDQRHRGRSHWVFQGTLLEEWDRFLSQWVCSEERSLNRRSIRLQKSSQRPWRTLHFLVYLKLDTAGKNFGSNSVRPLGDRRTEQ